MPYEALREVNWGVATVMLNRPAVLNAISPQIIEELQDVLNQVRDDPDVRAVVVTSAGRGYCWGDDYHGFAPMSEDNPCLLMRVPVYSCIYSA